MSFRNTFAILLVILLVGRTGSIGISSSPAVEVDEESDSAASIHEPFRLVFIYASESCECTLEQCHRVGEELKDLADSLTIPLRIDSVDAVDDWKEAGEMMKTYEEYFVPILVFLNDRDEVLFSLDGFFRPDTIGTLIDRALN